MNDPIRPRTDNECAAYLHGWAAAINLVDEHGVEAARDELKIMVFFEWPEDWAAPGVPTTKEKA